MSSAFSVDVTLSFSLKNGKEYHQRATAVKRSKIKVKPSLGRGRGVFAMKPIRRDEIIESCPVIRFGPKYRAALEPTPLSKYLYGWSHDGSEVAIALGYGSLYNHSDDPNAAYHTNRRRNAIDFIATRFIAAGEEITISYLNSFDSPKKLWFKAI
jgi:SET domain-containing protein